ncbi:MAG: radical SAM protein [Acetatifactor sp.]|nr:radical SAM protein [Acetatifactor sp.]
MEEINIKSLYSKNNYMYRAIIELTTLCNFKCIHCFLEQHTNPGLSTQKLKEIIDELRDFGVYELQFTGGEIFMRKDIMEIIRYARELKFKVSLLTNVSLISDEMIHDLESLYVEIISTTLFSTDNEVNDKITQTNNSATVVMDTIKKIATTDIQTEIKTVLMKDNADAVDNIRKFCTDNNILFLATEGLFPSVSGDESIRNLKMTDKQLCRNIRCLDEIRFGALYSKEKLSTDSICCELHYSLFIDSYGDVYPCNLWFKKIGNITEDKIADIWNCDFLKKIRNTTWRDLTECYKCKNNKYCIRCSGIVDNIKGNYLLSDPYACRTSWARSKVNKQST